MLMSVEPFLPGEYHKYNNNFGWVSYLDRNTPQAFSHFTHFISNGEHLVTDIQGVGDKYTDPQVCTGTGWGMDRSLCQGCEELGHCLATKKAPSPLTGMGYLQSASNFSPLR